MKKFILGILLLIGINSFSEYVDLVASGEIIVKNGWCSGKGFFLSYAENGGVMRLHDTCIINGEDFYFVMVTYHGFDKYRLSKPVNDLKKVYFRPNTAAIMNVYETDKGYSAAFQYYGNVDIK